MAELTIFSPRYNAQAATSLAELLDGVPGVQVVEDRRTAGPNRRRKRSMREGTDARHADRRTGSPFLVAALVRP